MLDASVVDKICSLYVGGMTQVAVAAEFGASQTTVRRWLSRKGIPIHPRSTFLSSYCKHTLNHDAFAVPGPEVNYFAGLMASDGSVHVLGNRSPQIRLTLSEIDKQHVYTFRGFLGSSHAVTRVAGGLMHGKNSLVNGHVCKPAYGISVGSIKLAKDLEKYGVVPKKSLTYCPPDWIAQDADYLRGICDGDGSLFVPKDGYPTLSLCGSLPMMEQFSKFIGANGTIRANKSIFVVSVRGAKAVSVIRRLYGRGGPSLPRKQACADYIMGEADKGLTRMTPRSAKYVDA